MRVYYIPYIKQGSIHKYDFLTLNIDYLDVFNLNTMNKDSKCLTLITMHFCFEHHAKNNHNVAMYETNISIACVYCQTLKPLNNT